MKYGSSVNLPEAGSPQAAAETNFRGLFADPYLNTDAGTMSPFEHGEVFVLNDGGEVFGADPHYPL